jgi:hypothetical protein
MISADKNLFIYTVRYHIFLLIHTVCQVHSREIKRNFLNLIYVSCAAVADSPRSRASARM